MPLHCAATRPKVLNFQNLPFFGKNIENRNHNFKMLPLSSILELTSQCAVSWHALLRYLDGYTCVVSWCRAPTGWWLYCLALFASACLQHHVTTPHHLNIILCCSRSGCHLRRRHPCRSPPSTSGVRNTRVSLALSFKRSIVVCYIAEPWPRGHYFRQIWALICFDNRGDHQLCYVVSAEAGGKVIFSARSHHSHNWFTIDAQYDAGPTTESDIYFSQMFGSISQGGDQIKSGAIVDKDSPIIRRHQISWVRWLLSTN